MVKAAAEKIKYFVLFSIGLLLSGCANQLPPGGGEIDRIPPSVVETYPENGTTEFHDEYIEFTFSEYVDKRTVKDALFISPAVDGDLELDWSGKSVRVYFPNPLKDSVTYVVTLGTDVVDYNNKNRMAESYTLTFSTGPEIDRRIISGRVYDEKPSGTMIFAYKLTADTVNPSTTKPDYISQAGDNGNFKLAGLAAGTYRVFAVADQFRDLLYQVEQDKIGVPFEDIKLAPEDTLFAGLHFFLTQDDTTSPRLIKTIMTDSLHILAEFSEEIDSTLITTDNFAIIDSTDKSTFKPLYIYHKIADPKQIVLVADTAFKSTNDYFLKAVLLKDKKGNTYKNDLSQISLSNKPDTTKPQIIKSVPADGGQIDFLNPSLSFYFDDAFDTTLAKTGIILSDTTNRKVGYSLSFPDNASIIIKPSGRLKSGEHYLVKFDQSRFRDAAGNKGDTIYTYRFNTINDIDFTGASGTIMNTQLTDYPLVLLQSTDKTNGKVYSQYLQKGSKFEFNRVFPGTYMLWCFLDRDSSRTYDRGNPYPFRPSEDFSFYSDTLNLRARWGQMDIKFNFK
ncbi:MAG TPA: Ig-like domain-containing protein [Ignavibacteriaceae bacterium]|nr:Ig-like domain-containing protein [Ignavibacteriaceae bacterium]